MNRGFHLPGHEPHRGVLVVETSRNDGVVSRIAAV